LPLLTQQLPRLQPLTLSLSKGEGRGGVNAPRRKSLLKTPGISANLFKVATKMLG
jgi:hypothetical protein